MSLSRPSQVRTVGVSGERLLPAVRRSELRHGLSMAEALRVAFRGQAANKLRSFLTMLGIIIGVASVIVMVALGQGAAQATQAAIQRLGTNVLPVMPNRQMRGGVSQGIGSAQSLRMEDADAILKGARSVKAVSAEYGSSSQVKYQHQNTRTTILGAQPEYFAIRNLPLAHGKVSPKTTSAAAPRWP